MDDYSKNPPAFSFMLSRQLITGLVLLIFIVLLVSSSVIWFKGRPLLESFGQRSQFQQGQNIALALEKRLAQIEGIAQSMATAGVNLPKDEGLFHSVVPSILNQLGKDSLIAGGGIWPEPNVYQQGLIRRSFFWGRGAKGELAYFDDYNDPSGPGYHNEEWYVPARLLKPGEVYWSKSYTDPYSLQPMVTCTAPMFQNGHFVGVATVDLKLDMVSLVLERLANGLDAYAFVVDRNNKFIAYPYPNRVMTERDTEGNKTPDFIYARELADIQRSFTVFSQRLSAIENKQLAHFEDRSDHYDVNVNLLANGSYQIDANEARRIAAHLWKGDGAAGFPVKVDDFEVARDSILGESASVVVFQMLNTNWKVVAVFRRSSFMVPSEVVSKQLVIYTSLATLLFGLIAYILLRQRILKPIRSMVLQLAHAVSSNQEDTFTLKYANRDELGILAYWFNKRSHQLELTRDHAKEANSAKTDFLAKMSHELRTPLNSILGFSRRLIENLRGDISDFHFGALERINANGTQLLQLINDILDVTAIESGLVKLHYNYHSANELMDEVKQEVAMLTKEKNLEFRVFTTDNNISIYCDKVKVIQVLSNLLSNAVKATARGYVRLRSFQLENRPEYIAFEVSDSGVGISEVDKKKLFKQFSQLDDKIAAERGTGIGLFLVHKYVQMHKGDVTFTSTLGEGSTFTIWLPIDLKL